ncbi:hypothetical protein AAE478_009292 [Parahypoxylon ruwenzoriense]
MFVEAQTNLARLSTYSDRRLEGRREQDRTSFVEWGERSNDGENKAATKHCRDCRCSMYGEDRTNNETLSGQDARGRSERQDCDEQLSGSPQAGENKAGRALSKRMLEGQPRTGLFRGIVDRGECSMVRREQDRKRDIVENMYMLDGWREQGQDETLSKIYK